MRTEELDAQGRTEEQFLKAYDDTKYRHPSHTADMILFTIYDHNLHVLLVERRNHPFIHQYALPGGFVEFNEDLDQAVLRELKEETNIQIHLYLKQLHTYGAVHRDPRTRVISTVYYGVIPSDYKEVLAGDDAKDADWFTVRKKVLNIDSNSRQSQLLLTNPAKDITMIYDVKDEVIHNSVHTTITKVSDGKGLAFDHTTMINYAIDQLRRDGLESGMLFHILPKEVALPEIQELYEVVINEPINQDIFNNSMRKMLIPCERYKIVKNQKEMLYRFDPLYPYKYSMSCGGKYDED